MNRSHPAGAREILALAIPALGALAADPLLGLLDTALVGRLGAPQLAALGAANALFSLFAASLIFLEYGTTARLARRFGAGQIDRLVREGIQMSWIAIALGAVFMLWLHFAPDSVLGWLDVPPEVQAPAATYLSIRAFGMIPSLGLRVGHGVFRGIQDTRAPLVIVVLMNAMNGVLDVLLIFGWSRIGLPAFGIAGAAWATNCAQWLGAIAMFVWLGTRLRALGFEGRPPLRLELGVLRELFGIGRDLLLRSLGLQAALFAGTRMAAAVGTAALAAHQVGWQLWLFLALLLDSLAIAGQALIARWLGAGEIEIARAVGRRLRVWGLVLGTAFALLFVALRPLLPRIFTGEPEVLAQIDRIFPLLAWMQIPNAWLFVLDGLLIGASDMRFLRNSMVPLGLFGAFTAWAGYQFTGTLLGVWLGIAVFMIVRTVAMELRWLSGRWVTAGE